MTSPEGDGKRRAVRTGARAASVPVDWLSKVLDHHERVETAFVSVNVKSSSNAIACVAARKEAVVILTVHANAEESVTQRSFILINTRPLGP
jgi:hypothetical protein